MPAVSSWEVFLQQINSDQIKSINQINPKIPTESLSLYLEKFLIKNEKKTKKKILIKKSNEYKTEIKEKKNHYKKR